MALLTIVSIYGGIYAGMTTVVYFQESERFDVAEARAVELAETTEELERIARPAGTPMPSPEQTAIDRVRHGASWFARGAPLGMYESDILAESGLDDLGDWLDIRRSGVSTRYSRDPCHDRAVASAGCRPPPPPRVVDPNCDLAFVGDYFADLNGAVSTDRASLSTNLRTSARVTLAFWTAAVALLATSWAMASRRRIRMEPALRVVRNLSEQPVARSRWSRGVHQALADVGRVLTLASLTAVGVAVKASSQLSLLTCAAILVGGLMVLPVGLGLLSYARPRAVPGVEQILLDDGRPLVLYLRAFNDDCEASSVDAMPASGPALGLESTLAVASREELLTTVIVSVGPMITVGRPGEGRPPMGGARIYLADENWQSGVSQLMQISRLVILRLGTGGGLWWELDYAVHHLPPWKLLMLLPKWPLAGDLPHQLEETLPYPIRSATSAAGEAHDWVSAVVAFDEGWRPHVVEIDVSTRRGSRMSPGHRLALALQEALTVVGIRRRGLPWRINGELLGSLLRSVALVIGVLALAIRATELVQSLTT